MGTVIENPTTGEMINKRKFGSLSDHWSKNNKLVTAEKPIRPSLFPQGSILKIGMVVATLCMAAQPQSLLNGNRLILH